MLKKKNTTLELMKLFASYMVVFVHVMFVGKFGAVMDVLARFAVPFFFLISGFYSYQIPAAKIKKRIKRILLLLILSSVVYTLFRVAVLSYYNDFKDVIAHFRQLLNWKTYLDLFLFNVPISSGHLWYLLAAAYVYGLFYLVVKFRVNEKIVYALSVFMLILQLILGECLSVFGITLPIAYVRNFACMGIPFFGLGLLAKKHADKLHTVSNFGIVLLVIIGIGESVLSHYLFGGNELYLGSLFILLAMGIVAVKYANVQYPKFVEILDGCSTYVYVFHIIVSDVIYTLYAMCNIDLDSVAILQQLHPVVVCIASTVFACLIQQISKKLLPGKKTAE